MPFLIYINFVIVCLGQQISRRQKQAQTVNTFILCEFAQIFKAHLKYISFFWHIWGWDKCHFVDWIFTSFMSSAKWKLLKDSSTFCIIQRHWRLWMNLFMISIPCYFRALKIF